MPGGPIGRAIRSICLEIASEAEADTRRLVGKNPADQPRTGKMARSWAVTVEGYPGMAGYAFVVKNTAKYAKFVDEGTQGPYLIQARKAKMLRFRGRDGQWRVVKAVTHPGIRNPYRILRRATRSVISRRVR